MADYEKQDDREKERFERRLMRYLEDLIREMDRKIAKAKDRADKESMPKAIKQEDQVKLDELQGRAKGEDHVITAPDFPLACDQTPSSGNPRPQRPSPSPKPSVRRGTSTSP